MRIKNDAIIIKNGNKTYEFTNLILDKYLEEFVNAQLNAEESNKTYNQKSLQYCLLKFEDELEFNKESNFPNETFDVCCIGDAEISQIANQNQITIQYNTVFNAETFVYDYSKRNGDTIYMQDYYGKKITAIGFNDWWTPTMNGRFTPVKAILDVSKYNLYLQKNQDFSVTRKDIISTDALFWSDLPKLNYPVHLAPNDIENIYNPILKENEHWGESAKSIIYSVGLGNDISHMLKEYVIGIDVNARAEKNKLIIENIPNLESVGKTYLSRFLPFYPTRGNYKYIIIKYKLWQILHEETEDDIILKYIDTNLFYHMAIPITETGNKNIVISYERS